MRDTGYPAKAGKGAFGSESTDFFEFESLLGVYPFLASGTLRGNFIVSDDGCVSVAGSSRGISNPEDLKLLIHLRQVSTGLIVGRKTAVAESYRPPKARPEYSQSRMELGLPLRPLLVVVTSSPQFAHSFRPEHQDVTSPILFGLLGGAGSMVKSPDPGRVILPLPPADEGVSLLLETLFERYPGPWLSEGGLTLLKSFSGLGLLDELCLTVSHRSVGDDCDQRVEILSELGIGSDVLSDVDTEEARYLRYEATNR
ncbi:MAG: hypothetical protein HKL83_08210 [Acidimicrobiaceae bacterium]|nr:hypothetical protein [Acidimicrobiaceae bacterium]